MAVQCRTLVVDDDPDMAYLVTNVIDLANHGLVVSGVASSGEEALAKLTTAAPVVIVLDFRMPGRNGLEVAAEILERCPGQHILLFSSYLDEETVTKAHRLGVRECVSKEQVKALPDIIRKYFPAA